MISLTIDGRRVQAKDGATILEAAQMFGIDIPTLCYHPVLTSYGACRLCSVEILQRGRSRMVVSCLYPAEEGLEIKTSSPRVQRLRRGIIELLLARCPRSERIREMARTLGVAEPRFGLENDECILCGLCIRVCHEISEKDLLSFVGRGFEKEVAAPFYEPPEECIACGGCAYVCPTGAIRMVDGKPEFLWQRKSQIGEPGGG
ncbi:2Fe-2S iron-sulfur cluster-binding protein [Dehalococcoidia bacterium]|nr:2Fe-2S iron-sulfur cluster-binding protein [Dehalococcoidia bacterium]